MSDAKLMQDYFSILEQCLDPDEKFKDSPSEKEFATTWLCKLCTEIYRGDEEKRLRNLYLLELSSCISKGALSQLFMHLPPKDKLPPLEKSSMINIDPKTILHDMQTAAAESIPLVNSKNFETHMTTKIFDDNQGACAYIAVSLADPGDGPVWLQMGGNEPYNPNKTQDLDKETCVDETECVDVSFIEILLNATANELAGFSEPNQCPVFEKQIDMYADFIKSYDNGRNTIGLNKNQLRTFLLVNFQADLLRALQRRREESSFNQYDTKTHS